MKIRWLGVRYGAEAGWDAAATDKRHRFPPAIIAHAVWLDVRFALCYRTERGVPMT